MSGDHSENNEKPPPRAETVPGTSLWLDAWRRLLKNRLSVAGMVVVFVMTVLSLLAGILSPFSPTAQERWIGSRPPMFRHPTVKNEMRLKRGEVADLPPEAISGEGRHEVTLTVEKISDDDNLRLKVVRGRIREIRIETGARLVPAFSVRGDLEYLTSLDDQDHPIGDRITDITLRVGGDPPFPVPESSDRKTVSVGVRWVRLAWAEPGIVKVTLEDDRVADLTVAGQPTDRITVSGREVLRIELDGEELAHTHLLGTDQSGRDLLSRIIYGGQISLGVGLAATIVSLLIGLLYGAFSGYFGGRVDNLMMRFVDILYAIPFMFLVIILLVNFGRNIWILFIALGAVQWLTMARIVRGQVLSLKEKEFIEAARMAGAGHLVMVFRHLIPNVMGVVVVYTTLTIPAVILQESFLAFIGLTVQSGSGESKESWGALVNQGVQALGSGGDRWWLLVFPSLAMAMTLFSMNFLGDGLRDALDPQQKGRT
jgi:oligopeptide transport system permease protein